MVEKTNFFEIVAKGGQLRKHFPNIDWLQPASPTYRHLLHLWKGTSDVKKRQAIFVM